MGNSISLHNKRKLRNRKALKVKSYGKLRLSVFRSSRHIYGQIIDDIQGITITAASSLEINIKKQFKNCGTKEVASLVGKKIAEKNPIIAKETMAASMSWGMDLGAKMQQLMN